MKKLMVLGAAALAASQVLAIPTDARRAEARTKAKTVTFALTKDQLAQFGMDGRQKLAKGAYTLFVGGGQPGFFEGGQTAQVKF